jgi:hypothetical protein
MTKSNPQSPDVSETTFLRRELVKLQALCDQLVRTQNRNAQLLGEAMQMLSHRQDAASLRLDDLYEGVSQSVEWQRITEDDALLLVAQGNLRALEAREAATVGEKETSTDGEKPLIVAPSLKLVQATDETEVYEFGGNGGCDEERQPQK